MTAPALHRFVVVRSHGMPDAWFDTVGEAFKAIDLKVDRVYVTLEPEGKRYRVLRS